ncbi:SH3 domain-containing protein [Sphingomonas sp.]|uniref:SH3 domain-containing protein n=1 Tax=Sphingomonas sp. TaxID=28214 RepID=UPI003751964D
MRWFAAGVMLVAVASAASAEDKKPPYWASIASGQAMMRTGPGRNYPGTWLYQRRDLPIRVVQVYNHWRKIEDPGGQQGWMLVTMLSDKRSAIVRPGARRDLHNRPDGTSHVAYKAEPGVVGRIAKCRDGWCRMTIAKREGFVRISDLWGLSDGESVD